MNKTSEKYTEEQTPKSSSSSTQQEYHAIRGAVRNEKLTEGLYGKKINLVEIPCTAYMVAQKCFKMVN